MSPGILFLACLLVLFFITVAKTDLSGTSILGISFAAIAGIFISLIWWVFS